MASTLFAILDALAGFELVKGRTAGGSFRR